MKKNNIINDFLTKYSSPEIEKYVSHNVDIAEQIHLILDKLGWTQKDLAKKLRKSEAEVSKWLSGQHNLTIKSISKIELALGEDIITTPKKAEKKYKLIEYVHLKIYAGTNQKRVTESYETSEGSRIKSIKLRETKTNIA